MRLNHCAGALVSVNARAAFLTAQTLKQRELTGKSLMYKMHGKGIQANYETMLLEEKDNVATIALNRPKKIERLE